MPLSERANCTPAPRQACSDAPGPGCRVAAPARSAGPGLDAARPSRQNRNARQDPKPSARRPASHVPPLTFHVPLFHVLRFALSVRVRLPPISRAPARSAGPGMPEQAQWQSQARPNRPEAPRLRRERSNADAKVKPSTRTWGHEVRGVGESRFDNGISTQHWNLLARCGARN